MKKILVVDDDSAMRWILKRLLEDKYEVIVKNNGIEAFSWLSVHNIPDLIISDIRMPQMDGYELLENLALSGHFKNIPVIMLSGFNDRATIKRCTDLGAYACVFKSFTPEKFLKTINANLSFDSSHMKTRIRTH